MNKLLILLTICIIAMLPFNVYAKETPSSNDNIEARLSSMKNPFKSQLPVPEIEDIEEEPESDEDEVEPLLEPEPNEAASNEEGLTDPSPKAVEIEEIIPLPDVKVSGIIWNSDRPQAIINGLIVDIGDNILGIQITEIRKTGIDGLFHGRAVTIQTQRSQL